MRAGVCFAILSVWFLGVVGIAGATTLSYTGYLTDSSGNPLDGSYDVEFRLYDSASGGTELDSYSTTVSVSNGYFSKDIVFDREYFDGRDLWLEISVEGETLSPRISLNEVPYAAGMKPGFYVKSDSNGYLACFNNTLGSKAELANSGLVYSINPPMVVEAWDYGVTGEGENALGVLGYNYYSLTKSEVAGVYGRYDNATGMLGTEVDGSKVGVFGMADNYGVYGTGSGYGVYGVGESGGVYGKDSATNSYGILGFGTSGVVGVGYYSFYGTGNLYNTGNGEFTGDVTVGGKLNAGVVEVVNETTGVYGAIGSGYYSFYGEGNAYIDGSLDVDVLSVERGSYLHNFLYVYGDFVVVGGAKNFMMQHPLDSSKKIYYAAMEGPEVGIYLRGSAKLKDGYAVINFPDYFSLIASGNITAQVTAKYDGKFTVVNVEEVTNDHLSVRGVYLDGSPSNAEFDYIVYAERIGYEDYKPVR